MCASGYCHRLYSLMLTLLDKITNLWLETWSYGRALLPTTSDQQSCQDAFSSTTLQALSVYYCLNFNPSWARTCEIPRYLLSTHDLRLSFNLFPSLVLFLLFILLHLWLRFKLQRRLCFLPLFQATDHTAPMTPPVSPYHSTKRLPVSGSCFYT